MKVYKLTDQDMKTFCRFSWEIGKEVSLSPCENPQLCSSDVIHVYRDPDVALLLNPTHASFSAPRLFVADGDIVVEDWGKAGVFSLTLLEEMPLPGWYSSVSDRVDVCAGFAVGCAEAVLPVWTAQFPDDDRPSRAIQVARERGGARAADASYASYASARASAYAALTSDTVAYAADASSYAALASAYAARTFDTVAYAARISAYAALTSEIVAYAADASSYAAYAAARAAKATDRIRLDVIDIARAAITGSSERKLKETE